MNKFGLTQIVKGPTCFTENSVILIDVYTSKLTRVEEIHTTMPKFW